MVGIAERPKRCLGARTGLIMDVFITTFLGLYSGQGMEDWYFLLSCLLLV